MVLFLLKWNTMLPKNKSDLFGLGFNMIANIKNNKKLNLKLSWVSGKTINASKSSQSSSKLWPSKEVYAIKVVHNPNCIHKFISLMEEYCCLISNMNLKRVFQAILSLYARIPTYFKPHCTQRHAEVKWSQLTECPPNFKLGGSQCRVLLSWLRHQAGTRVPSRVRR